MTCDIEEASLKESIEWAFQPGRPIITPDLLLRRPKVKPMSSEWLAGLSEKWWATHFNEGVPIHELKRFQANIKLRDRLLEFGGEQACMPWLETDLKALLEYGQVWHPTNLLMRKGRDCSCHENAALLWEQNTEISRIATGYGLSNDGMWRQHSWCIEKIPNRNRVVETTTKRLLYFGFVMTTEQCHKFYDENVL